MGFDGVDGGDCALFGVVGCRSVWGKVCVRRRRVVRLGPQSGYGGLVGCGFLFGGLGVPCEGLGRVDMLPARWPYDRVGSVAALCSVAKGESRLSVLWQW